jgi:iron complex outermembrane receptor protein
MNQKMGGLSLSVAAMISMGVAVPASAQSLEEVVVTARKRSERLLEVPLSVNAFTAEEITRAGMYDMKDIAALSAGLTFQNNQSSSSFVGRMSGGIAFRGAQIGAGASARDNTGSIFIDGIYVASGLSSVNLSDVERVEVLKGPQNAYFGRNTFSGAVNLITRNPGDRFAGALEAAGGTRGSYDFGASAEGPLGSTRLSGRLVVGLHRKGAQYTATDGGSLGVQNSNSVVGTIYATPADNAWMRVRLHYQRDDDGPDLGTFLRGLQYGSLCPGQRFQGSDAAGSPVQFAVSRPYFCGRIPSIDDLGTRVVSTNTTVMPPVLARIGVPFLFRNLLVNNSIGNPRLARAPGLDHLGMRRDTVRGSGQGEYRFSNGTALAGHVGYEWSNAIAANDIDKTDSDNSYAVLPQRVWSLSGELRLVSPQTQRIRWLIGASLYRQAQEQQQFSYSINTAFGQPPPTTTAANPQSIDRARVPAGFAAVDYDLLPKVTLSGEVRYQSDTSTIAGATSSIDVKVNNWLPRAIVKVTPIDDLMLYASWAKAVMPGNPNSAFITASPSQQAEIRAAFPDAGEIAPVPEMDAYEIGIKQRLWNDRLEYAISAYDMKWRNINTNVSIPVSTSPFLLSVVRANDARLKGLELEAQGQLTDDWTARVVLDIKHDRLTRYYNAIIASLTSGVVNFVGNVPPRSPQFTGTLSSTYRRDLNGDWMGFLRGDVVYTGKQWESEANIGYLAARTVVNARMGVESDALRVELFANNLFDDRNWLNGLRATSVAEPGALLQVPYNGSLTTVQGVLVTPPDRREIGLRASFRF